jgi:hypothetical protein
MVREAAADRKRGLEQVLLLLTEALDLLDGCAAPPQAAAHIEMALAEIRRSTTA